MERQGDPGAAPAPVAHPIRLAEQHGTAAIPFDLAPDAGARAALAEALGIEAVRKLRFAGTIRPVGERDWELEAELGATVVQPCVVTLAPVTTRIDETVSRRYLAEMPAPGTGEVEMPEDETAEPLPAVVDIGQVMAEALALALPLYPRADGADMGEAVFTEPGQKPMTDADARPFAGLAALRGKLSGDDAE